MAAGSAIRFDQQRHKAVWFPKSSQEMTYKSPMTSSRKVKIIFRQRLATTAQPPLPKWRFLLFENASTFHLFRN
ncbi:MAG: hypothetical protein HF981_13275 [Desulfobacteraceae bacterium]|nr:hypothetical protein [Desulfobacteraceae bacterium]MBC2751352.1 hypothetical protein [Desulfobacteraceae bacterium]